MKDIPFEQLDPFYFRKEKMRACMQETLDTINGRSEKLSDLIFENGKLSGKKLDGFIKELMECLEIFLSYRLSSKEGSDPKKTEVLNEKQHHCFSNFFYFAISELSIDPEAQLCDLIDVSYRTPIYSNYIELLLHYFEKRLRSHENRKTNPSARDPYEQFVGIFDSGHEPFDLIDSFLWHHFRILQPEGISQIMDFAYQMDASQKEIGIMLDILKRHGRKIPEEWLSDYDSDKERYRTRKHPLFDQYSRGEVILAFWNFLHLQSCLRSSEAFINAISGMIDVYAVSTDSSILTDPDRFYTIYDNLQRIRSFSLKTEKREVR